MTQAKTNYTTLRNTSIFAIFLFSILIVCRYYYIQTCGELSIFLSERSFFQYYMERPGGLLAYLGQFFSLFLCNPFIGIALYSLSLSLLSLLIQITLSPPHSLRWLTFIPSLFLLAKSIALGEYIFINTQGGFFFLPLVALGLCFGLFYMVRQKIKGPLLSALVLWLSTVAFFYLGGVYAFCFLPLALYELSTSMRYHRCRYLYLGAYLILLPLSLYLGICTLYAYYPQETLFKANIDNLKAIGGYLPEIYQYILFLLPLILTTGVDHCPLHTDRHRHRASIALLLLSVLSLIPAFHQTRDAEKRCKALYLVSQNNYYDLLSLSEKLPQKSVPLIYASLAQSNQLLPRLFQVNKDNARKNMLFEKENFQLHPENLYVLQSIGHYALAYHWAYENFVFRAPSYFNLYQLAKLSLINGEIALARKYGRQLSHTFSPYRKKGKEILALCDNPTEIAQKYKVQRALVPQKDILTSLYDSPEAKLPELYVLSGRNTQSLQYAIVAILLNKQPEVLTHWLSTLEEKGYTPLPIPVQEALYWLTTQQPELRPSLEKWLTDHTLEARFKSFLQWSRQTTDPTHPSVPENIRSTYWYHELYSSHPLRPEITKN